MTQSSLERLQQLEAEALPLSRKFADGFEDNYRGKVIFLMSLALAAKTMSTACPGIRADDFIESVKEGATLWVESGEPLK